MLKKRRYNNSIIIECYQKYNDVNKVAKELNLTRRYLLQKLYKLGYRKKTDQKTIPDNIIIESYNRLNNVWLVGKEIGLCGQTIWERLSKLNLITNNNRNVKNKFKDYNILKDKYTSHRDSGTLNILAKELNRTIPFICRKAKELGLTDYSHIHSDNQIKKLGIARSLSFKINGHPKGMLGKHHSKKVCEEFSRERKERWKNYSPEKKKEELNKTFLKQFINNGKGVSPDNRKKCSWKCGWRTINNIKYYFRSEWEYIYALYLEYFKNHNKIINWEHEVKRFVFDTNNIYDSYLPDFKVISIKNDIEWHEVKGWMDQRSIDKLFKMDVYYPNEKIILIQADWFKKHKNKYKIYGYEK